MEAVCKANNSHNIRQRKMNYRFPFMPYWGGDDDDDESSLLRHGAVSVSSIVFFRKHFRLGWVLVFSRLCG